jgi:hypothetical protein
MSHVRDARIWGPLAAAAIGFAVRALPPAPAGEQPTAQSFEVPPMHGAPPPRTELEYDLDPADSEVTFLVEGTGGEMFVRCPGTKGRLQCAKDGTPQTFELVLDLVSLAPEETGTTSGDLRHLLGVHRDDEVTFQMQLAASTTANVPAVTGLHWVGRLRLGSRVIRQPMNLWLCRLPGRPLRMQGHGTVGTESYGLPRRARFGLFREQHVVTVGLDLAFRRRSR